MKTPAPAGTNTSPHLKNLRNFVEQFIIERDGLTGETALRVSDNMPVTCDEMSLMLLACSLAEADNAQLVAEVQACRQTMASLERGQDELLTERDALRAALSDFVQAYDVKMGPGAVRLRVEIARDLLSLSAPSR